MSPILCARCGAPRDLGELVEVIGASDGAFVAYVCRPELDRRCFRYATRSRLHHLIRSTEPERRAEAAS